MAQATAIAPSLSGQYWQWQGQSIYYVKAGNRHPQYPPLLLVHGFGASTDHWRKNIADLSLDFEVWAIDLLGFGRSAKPNQQYSGNLWRNQIHDFITQVIQQPTVLAGNSLGGYTCLCVAAYHPDMAAGLVLLNSAGPFSDAQPTLRSNVLRELAGKFTQVVLQQDWASFLLFQYARQKSTIRQTLERVYLDRTAITDQLIEDIYRPACDPDAPKVFAAVFRTPQGDCVDILLQQLHCPLLLIWGEADPWINARERGIKFRQHYPSLTEYYLRAGHCPHDEVPNQVNALMRDWLRTLLSS